jgi:hypothetical protein
MPAGVVVAYEWAEPTGLMPITLRHLSLLLALMLAIAPRLAAAEGHSGSGPVTPLRAPTRDYAALFRSPGSRITQYPIGPSPLYTAAIAGALPPGSAGAVCRAALAAAEARYAIPAGLLQAIGIVESGRRNEVTGARQPWPWTINVEGESHYFDTKAQAVTWVRQAQARGTRSIDTGCAGQPHASSSRLRVVGTGIRSSSQRRLRCPLPPRVTGDSGRELDDRSGLLSLADSGSCRGLSPAGAGGAVAECWTRSVFPEP